MNIVNLLYLISFFTVISIFFILTTRKYKTKATKSMIFLLFCFSSWNIFSLLRVSMLSKGIEHIILGFLRASWSFSSICFLIFIYNFLKRKKDFMFYVFVINHLIGLYFLFFTNMLFMDGIVKAKYGYVGIYSTYFVELVLLFFITPVIYGIFLIVKDIIDNKNITDSKEHFRIILYTLITLTLLIGVDILLGSFDSSSSPILGNIFVTVFSVFLYFTVIKTKTIFSGFDVLSGSFLDQVNNPIVMTDENDKIIHINKSSNIFDDNIIGNDFFDVFSVSSDEKNPYEFKCDIDGKKSFYQIFFYSSYVYGYEAGKTYIFNDITREKNAQYDLDLKIVDLKKIIEEKQEEIDRKIDEYKNDEMLYKDLFDKSDDSLILIELENFRILKVNNQALNVYGYLKKEIEGMDANHLADDYEASIRKFISVIKKNGDLPTIFYKHKKKSGDVFPVEIRAFIFNVENKKVMLAVVKDLSEYSRNRKALMVSQRLGVSSLVLNNISSIFYDIYIEIEKKVNLLNSVRKEGLENMFKNIYSAISNGKSLLEDVLKYSKNLKVNQNKVRIKEAFIKNMQHYKNKFQRLHIDFEYNSKLSKNIKIKEEDFDKIILILLSNAEHAVMLRDKAKIEISCIELGEKIILKVSDNGIGIKKQYKEKIFDPFFSLKHKNAPLESPWRNVNAIGMGLSILESIVRDYQGSIRLESEYKKGSVFEIILNI